MKRFFLIASLFAMGARCIFAQTATDENEGAKLTLNPTTGAHTFSWWGKTGRTYFIQHSSDLLTGWTYVPVIEVGEADVTAWNFTSTDASGVTSEKFFIRLKGSDIPTSNPLTADFDEDGVGNMDELNQATDPMLYVDSEPDGLSDAWEIMRFGNLSRDGIGDLDSDGMTDLYEYMSGFDPDDSDDAGQDADGDGTSNASEATQGSGANKKDNPQLQLSAHGFVAP